MTVKAAQTRKSPAAKTARMGVAVRPDRSFADDFPSMEEPSLREMLRDPIIQRLMTSDGITKSQFLTLIAAARSKMNVIPAQAGTQA